MADRRIPADIRQLPLRRGPQRLDRHAHAAAQHGLEEGSAEWAEWVKDYYRDVETYDWVDVADNLRGPEAFFHRIRARDVRDLVATYGRGPYLDAGCGTGLNLRDLPPGSVGIDINPRNVALVRSRLPDRPVFVADIEDIPFPGRTFGTIICTEVLEHVPDPDGALEEIARVLKPGGVLIGTTPAHSPIWRLRFLSSTCPRDEPFHNEYTADEIRDMLEGWELLHLGYTFLRFGVRFVARRHHDLRHG